MIDKAHILEILNKHFFAINEVQKGIFCASQKFDNRDYAIRYFDLTGDFLNIINRLKEYQEDLMSDTYFGPKYPSDLRWNHYLYIVVSNIERDNEKFNNYKKCIEADRTYARKIVLTEKELDSHFISNKKALINPPADLTNQWSDRLDKLDLSYILDDDISVPEAARMIMNGKKMDKVRISNRIELTESEKIAGNQFLKSITINGFRRYPSKKSFDFGTVNLITGRNGVGKTSLLEAIEYLYCGANKRHNDITVDMEIVGRFNNDTDYLLTSSQSNTANLRARNAKWYAKVDVKKLTLTDSFAKFNYLDTDAAVDLSNNNDSDDRLSKDVVRLLLGSEAENIRLKLSRVSEHIGREILNIKKSIGVIQSQIKDHQGRLEDIRNTPQTSDALYDELLNILQCLEWKNMPNTKHDAFKISSNLHIAMVASRKLVATRDYEGNLDLKSLGERLLILESDLEKSKKLARNINHLQAVLTESHEYESVLRLQQISVEVLTRYAKTRFVEQSAQLEKLRDNVDRISSRFSSMENSLDALDEIRLSNSLLKDALLSADSAVNQESRAVYEQKENIKTIEASMFEVNILKQELISLATEVIAIVAEPDHCPLCRTKFDAGQLSLRMLLTNEDESSKSLKEMHAKLSDAQKRLTTAKNIHTALKALFDFVEPHVEQTVKRALRSVNVLRKALEQDRQNLKELELVIEQYSHDRLTISDLNIHLAKLDLPKLPSESELVNMQKKWATKLFKHINSNALRKIELSESLVALTQLTGINEVSTNEIPEVHVQHLRALLTDIHQLITAAKILDSFIYLNPLNVCLLDARLGLAFEQITRLLTVLKSEKHTSDIYQSEEIIIRQHEDSLNIFISQLSRMSSASALIEDLLKQAKDDNFAYKMMRDGVDIIKDIFAEIHFPNEFILQTDNSNSLAIYRDNDMNNKVELRQMSTGQRAAFALSLFLSMNKILTSGPPIMLLDDPIAQIDDLNILSFLDHLRDIVVGGYRQIFFTTADEKLAGLFRQKFQFMGQEKYREFELSRC